MERDDLISESRMSIFVIKIAVWPRCPEHDDADYNLALCEAVVHNNEFGRCLSVAEQGIPPYIGGFLALRN